MPMRLFILLSLSVIASAARGQWPLELPADTRVALVGNGLFDQMREHGHFEALLQKRFAGRRLVLRNLAWSADEVALRPRPEGFGDLNDHLSEHRADVILAAFGFNESFKGQSGLGEFSQLLKAFVIELRSHHYNGRNAPLIVLVSPVPAQAPHAHLNAQIAAYAQAMKEVARQQGIGFADVFTDLQAATGNGIHLNASGYEAFAKRLYEQLLQETAPPVDPALLAPIAKKEELFFQHHRPLNYYYIKGGRMEPYGVVNFPGELKRLLELTQRHEAWIWDLAAGKAAAAPDLKGLEPLPVITGDRPINEWLPATKEREAFVVDPRFEVTLFASEEDFPEMVKPIQMRFDAKGRMWLSTSTTYPQIEPGQAPQDRLLILEDRDGDHRADQCKVWADKLAIPLSFEIGQGGVWVSEQPHLLLLRDRDGDDRADEAKRILSGFGTEDSHHALHDFTWSPEGDLIFRESIFHHSQVETPFGPVRARESSFFRYRTSEGRLQAFGSYLSTNPWGIVFDEFGFHLGSHPVFAEAVHALNAPYPQIHVPAGSYFPAYSGTCGQEFLSSPHWPEELRQKRHFMRARYKPTNEIELHEWVLHDSHYEEKKVGVVLQSQNLSFIPVDIQQGPDGAIYVVDWYNPVKGHAQYSLRDTRRDKKSGRIWRIAAKGRPSQPVLDLSAMNAAQLMEVLRDPDHRNRYRARRALRDLKQPLPKVTPENGAHALELAWLGQLSAAEFEPLAKRDAALRAAWARMLRTQGDNAALRRAVGDVSALVRLEAAIAASYRGTAEALEIALGLLDQPMDTYLTYALRTALDSEPLQRHWKDKPAVLASHPKLVTFLKDSEPNKPAVMAKRRKAEPPNPFDDKPGLQTVTIKTIAERLLYDVREFKVKANSPVKVIFENPDVTPHNWILVLPGAADEVGMAGNEMAKTPDGMQKGFVPNSPKILQRTGLIAQGEREVLRFMAPANPGRYPYICTFPGHWLVMKGEMLVEP